MRRLSTDPHAPPRLGEREPLLMHELPSLFAYGEIVSVVTAVMPLGSARYARVASHQKGKSDWGAFGGFGGFGAAGAAGVFIGGGGTATPDARIAATSTRHVGQ